MKPTHAPRHAAPHAAFGASLATAALLLLAGCAGGMSGSSSPAGMGNGMVTVKSPYPAAETMARLDAEVKKRNLAVLARVDHAAGAQRVNMTLRPTELMIFGNPQAGTPLMLCAQGVGIDLPMKALVWVDAQQQTWLSYNDPVWVVGRHSATACPAAENVRKALSGIAEAVVAR